MIKGFITQMRRYGNYHIDIDRDVYSIYYTGKKSEKRKITLLEPEMIDNTFFFI